MGYLKNEHNQGIYQEDALRAVLRGAFGYEQPLLTVGIIAFPQLLVSRSGVLLSILANIVGVLIFCYSRRRQTVRFAILST